MTRQEAIPSWRQEFFPTRGDILEEEEYDAFEEICTPRFIHMNIGAGLFHSDHCHVELCHSLLESARKYAALQHYSLAKMEQKLRGVILSLSPAAMKYVRFDQSSLESTARALELARRITDRTTVICLGNIASAEGISVPHNDLRGLEAHLRDNSVACVAAESFPAYDGYLKRVGELAHDYGALYIADETTTGLMRSGAMWCAVNDGAEPDMIVTGRDITGNSYPLSALIMNERAGNDQQEKCFDELFFFDHAKLGCAMATQVLEIVARTSTKTNVSTLSRTFRRGLHEIRQSHPAFIRSLCQQGLLMSLEIAHAEGAAALRDCLYENTVIAAISPSNPALVQLRAGLLTDQDLAEKALDILDLSLAQTAERFGFY